MSAEEEITDFDRRWYVDRKIMEQRKDEKATVSGCISSLMVFLILFSAVNLTPLFVRWTMLNFDAIREGKDPIKFSTFMHQTWK